MEREEQKPKLGINNISVNPFLKIAAIATDTGFELSRYDQGCNLVQDSKNCRE